MSIIFYDLTDHGKAELTKAGLTIDEQNEFENKIGMFNVSGIWGAWPGNKDLSLSAGYEAPRVWLDEGRDYAYIGGYYA